MLGLALRRDLEPYQRILPPELSGALFGAPGDKDYWAAGNPASIVAADPGRIRDAGLAIYLECGDEDAFGFHEGAEFLHRLLWDHGIRHEYRLIRGADHVGATLLDRSRDRFLFIARHLEPHPPVPAVEIFRKKREDVYRELGYEPSPFSPYESRQLEHVQ